MLVVFTTGRWFFKQIVIHVADFVTTISLTSVQGKKGTFCKSSGFGVVLSISICYFIFYFDRFSSYSRLGVDSESDIKNGSCCSIFTQF